MDFNELTARFKTGWDLPRALQWSNWALIFSMALATGFLAATGFEAFLNVPPTSVRPLPNSAQPQRSVSLPFDEFQASIEHNLFGVEVGNDQPEAPEEPQTPQGDLAAWVARLELAGVYEGKKQRAIVTEKSTGQQGLFAAGEQLFEGPKFMRIGGNLKEPKILLAMGGQEAWLELPKGPATPVQTAPPPRRSQAPRAARGAAAAPPGESYSKNGKDFYITSAEVDAQLNNLPSLLNQARVVPYFQDGNHAGYIIKAIDRGSLYEKLGLRNQDVIKRINGETIDSPEEAFSLLKMLRNEREITLNIERKKAPKTLVYHIN